MRLLGIHAGHDGHVCLIRDGELVFSIEAEKDSNPRYTKLSDERMSDALDYLDGMPDVLAISGWEDDGEKDAGYEGLDNIYATTTDFLGKKVRRFSSSHERAHIMSSYGMSPFEPGRPCYALVMEGSIGGLYAISSDLRIERLASPLDRPGHRYAFLFELADMTASLERCGYAYGVAGKLMALASFSRRGLATPEEQRLIDQILDGLGSAFRCKGDLVDSPYFNVGVTDDRVKEVSGKLSDALFDRFHAAAKETMTEGWPLLISGGCGLNCEWNSKWKDSGLFADVFVPPCANDTGAAIGTAIDAQRHYTGDAKITWSVYCGEPFHEDVDDFPAFEVQDLDEAAVAEFLGAGKVVAWVQGECEMGPRALGNRSILAAPFEAASRDRLNEIKRREDYRPIAPVCLEEEVSRHFDWTGPSPFMLYFQDVLAPELAAITHVDGTARAQTVRSADNPRLHRLLTAFRKKTGFGVLCNTSLNFNGYGFINRMSDLVKFVTTRGLDGMVVGGRFFRHDRKAATPEAASQARV